MPNKKSTKPQKTRKTIKSTRITEKKKSKSKVEKLKTGSREKKKIGARVVYIYKPEEGGEQQRTSKTKLLGAGTRAKKIDINKLDPGSVFTFLYSGPDAHDPKPIVILLGEAEGLIHGINAKYMTKQDLRNLRTIIMATDPAIQNPKSFYENIVKRFTKKLDEGGISAYRTYAKSRMSNVAVYYTNIMEIE